MPHADLATQARGFAQEVTELLNATITNGVTFSAVLGRQSGTLVLGRGVTKTNLDPQAVPLTLGRRDPSAWLWVAFILGPDPEDEYLTVFKSGFALYADPDRERMMLHYDYEREPTHSYPPAHVQVQGTAGDLSALSERRSGQRKDLKDFGCGSPRGTAGAGRIVALSWDRELSKARSLSVRIWRRAGIARGEGLSVCCRR